MKMNHRPYRMILVMAMALFSAIAFAQEWEYSLEWQTNDTDTLFSFMDADELPSGRIAVISDFCHRSGAGDFYASQSALMLLDHDGNQLAQRNFFRSAYCCTRSGPFVFENDGNLFMLTCYSPDHDSTYFNYFRKYDNPPDDAFLCLYKLDDDLSILETHETHYPIDTFELRDPIYWEPNPNEYSGHLFLHSAFLDDDQTIVGAYIKAMSKGTPLEGCDSLFFFRMNLNGDIIAQTPIAFDFLPPGNCFEFHFRRHHLVKTDEGYIYYTEIRLNDVPENVVFLDENLNVVRSALFQHIDAPFLKEKELYDLTIKRSKHGTTYLTTQLACQTATAPYDYDCRLYECDDRNIPTQQKDGVVPVVRYAARGLHEIYDKVAQVRGVDMVYDNAIYFAYSLNVGMMGEFDSWIMIECLDNHFDTIRTVYYDIQPDLIINSVAMSVTATEDGGAILVFGSYNLYDYNQRWTTVTKFPAEAFVGIKEAHDNGLKVAIAYPNPGKDVLNIRTGLRNAYVEIYDMDGRLVHSQEITEDVTAINAESWPSGMYFWKVYVGPSTSSGSLAESGKWVKE